MRLFILIAVLLSPVVLLAQTKSGDSNDSLVKTIYTEETFKSSRVVIGQGSELPPNGYLVLLVSHHFGAINTGFYEFFGLDQASTRIGVEYGINDFLAAGFGRSTYEKTWDGYIKAKILRQSTGKRKMPLSVTLFGNMAVNTLKVTNPEWNEPFDARLSYCTELIIARMFGKIFSFQLAPTWVHKNLVPTPDDHNDLWSLSGGASFRVSDMISINAEYHYLFPGQHLSGVTNSIAIGVDIKTGLHVFQLFFTNSQPNFDQAFITETTGKWYNGDIYFGFNIHRLFRVKTPKNK
jgi:hypothetical protein